MMLGHFLAALAAKRAAAAPRLGALALVGVASGVLAPWGYWIDRSREVRLRG